MQFISLVYVLPCLFATTIAQSVSFNTEQQEALLTKVASDIRSYPSEYVDFLKRSWKLPSHLIYFRLEGFPLTQTTLTPLLLRIRS